MRKSTVNDQPKGILAHLQSRKQHHWRMQEKNLQLLKKNKHLFFFSGVAKWFDLESDVKNWITATKKPDFCVCKMQNLWRQRLIFAHDVSCCAGITLCYRFIKRHALWNTRLLRILSVDTGPIMFWMLLKILYCFT